MVESHLARRVRVPWLTLLVHQVFEHGVREGNRGSIPENRCRARSASAGEHSDENTPATCRGDHMPNATAAHTGRAKKRALLWRAAGIPSINTHIQRNRKQMPCVFHMRPRTTRLRLRETRRSGVCEYDVCLFAHLDADFPPTGMGVRWENGLSVRASHV